MTATVRNPRVRTEQELIELAQRAKRAPASLKPIEVAALAFYWLSQQTDEVRQ